MRHQQKYRLPLVHRFLASAAQHHAKHEAGIVEVYETFFLEPFKGQRQLPREPRKRGGVSVIRGTGKDQIPVIVVRDRKGQTADFKLAKLDGKHVREALLPLIDPESVLCSDGTAVYAYFDGHRASPVTLYIRAPVSEYTRALQYPERQYLSQPTEELDDSLSWRGHPLYT